MTEEHEEEIEVIDVSLNEHEIDEVIAHLIELKEHKESVQIPIAADLDLSVTYDNNPGDKLEGGKSSQNVVIEGNDGDDPDGDDGDDDNPDGDEDNPDGNDIENSEKLEEVK